jgi:hypothetical protein
MGNQKKRMEWHTQRLRTRTNRRTNENTEQKWFNHLEVHLLRLKVSIVFVLWKGRNELGFLFLWLGSFFFFFRRRRRRVVLREI